MINSTEGNPYFSKLLFNTKNRPISDFTQDGNTKDVGKLRYDHYMKRYVQTVMEVIDKKRQICKNIELRR